jgi:hypothetical protein
MRHTGIGSTANRRRARLSCLVALLPALAFGTAACGSAETGASSTGASGAATTATTPSSTPKSTDKSTPTSEKASADTPAAAVETWVTQILQERYTEACLATAPAMPKEQDPATVCNGPDVKQSLASLHEAWAKPGVKLPPEGKVKATGVTAQGETVTVPDTAISVDGRTLHDLALIGATGNVDSFSFSLEMQKRDGVWFVGDLHIKF